MTTKQKRRRLTKEEKQALQQEALTRATQGQTLSNFPAIFTGFMEKGIPESEIKPRENVLTYHAWRALGRQVRKGEKGVKVVTMVPTWDKSEQPHNDADNSLPDKDKKKGKMRPFTAVVFHFSQTDPMNVAQLDQRDQAHIDQMHQHAQQSRDFATLANSLFE
jgi:hypothetical protein